MKTKTFKRSLILKGCKKDFGLGTGVLVQDQIKFSDERRWGWKHPSFLMSILDNNQEFINQHIEVKMVEIKPKRKRK